MLVVRGNDKLKKVVEEWKSRVRVIETCAIDPLSDKHFTWLGHNGLCLREKLIILFSLTQIYNINHNSF